MSSPTNTTNSRWIRITRARRTHASLPCEVASVHVASNALLAVELVFDSAKFVESTEMSSRSDIDLFDWRNSTQITRSITRADRQHEQRAPTVTPWNP